MQIEQKSWYINLREPIKILIDESIRLIDKEKQSKVGDENRDFGFVVFSAAKAYEGYLKDYFYYMNLISREALRGEHFRIGKAINPNLPKRYRNHDWLYDDLTDACGEELAQFLWKSWREARNRVFHFQYQGENQLSLAEAEKKVELIFMAIEKAEACGLSNKNEEDE